MCYILQNPVELRKLKIQSGNLECLKIIKTNLAQQVQKVAKTHTTPATEIKATDFYHRVITRDKVIYIFKNITIRQI